MLTPAAFCARMCFRPGRPNASVLPEPVAAMPTRSLPDWIIGQHCAWIGDGCANVLVDRSRSAEKPALPGHLLTSRYAPQR